MDQFIGFVRLLWEYGYKILNFSHRFTILGQYIKLLLLIYNIDNQLYIDYIGEFC